VEAWEWGGNSRSRPAPRDNDAMIGKRGTKTSRLRVQPRSQATEGITGTPSRKRKSKIRNQNHKTRRKRNKSTEKGEKVSVVRTLAATCERTDRDPIDRCSVWPRGLEKASIPKCWDSHENGREKKQSRRHSTKDTLHHEQQRPIHTRSHQVT